MVIDARGLRHPDHIKEFKRQLEGYCTVHEDIEVILDKNQDDLGKLEMYIRACRANYTVEETVQEEAGFLRVKIKAPFCMCG